MKCFTLLLVVLAFSTTSYSQWQLQNSGTSENLNDVAILNQSAAIVVGDNGTILKTSNNGNEWNPINSGTINKLNAVSFSMMGEGVAVGDGVICLSTDQLQSGHFLFFSLLLAVCPKKWRKAKRTTLFTVNSSRPTKGMRSG